MIVLPISQTEIRAMHGCDAALPALSILSAAGMGLSLEHLETGTGYKRHALIKACRLLQHMNLVDFDEPRANTLRNIRMIAAVQLPLPGTHTQTHILAGTVSQITGGEAVTPRIRGVIETQPEHTQPGLVQRPLATPGARELGASGSGIHRAASREPGGNGLGAHDAAAHELGASGQDIHRATAREPGISMPGALGAAAREPGTSGQDNHGAVAHEPGTSRPGRPEAATRAPGGPGPDASGLDTWDPGTRQPGAHGITAGKPDTPKPITHGPGPRGRGIQEPDVRGPSPQVPGALEKDAREFDSRESGARNLKHANLTSVVVGVVNQRVMDLYSQQHQQQTQPDSHEKFRARGLLRAMGMWPNAVDAVCDADLADVLGWVAYVSDPANKIGNRPALVAANLKAIRPAGGAYRPFRVCRNCQRIETVCECDMPELHLPEEYDALAMQPPAPGWGETAEEWLRRRWYCPECFSFPCGCRHEDD